MVDTLGWRLKFGIVTPSTNTVVQPHFDDLRPEGVTNHIARMHIPDDPLNNNDDFDELIGRIDAALEAATERVMTCHPDHFILGISAESVWGGSLKAAANIEKRIRKVAGKIDITQAATALPVALKAYGLKKPRVSMVTPYYPVAEQHLRRYAKDVGFTIVRMKNLACKSPVLIGHVPEPVLRKAIQEVDGPDVDCIVQFGANLPFYKVGAEAERWLGKPVIPVLTATYWHALRKCGIKDKVKGFGRLLEEF